ncbi:hypothetical protein RFI_21492 [Reticulomyxa filosa]|uniref:Uncharacterized protein n=1 Tax=Reticulomyxa filosa TaxID=46433 RepID=X6MPH9_RETFI|nr:hypothetical protein RFI_21492 [Reticulomyxa filosa]|eukprot:ETO15873.1 hypothetical protein RFI_21492 [Reticulomyxa filosa]
MYIYICTLILLYCKLFENVHLQNNNNNVKGATVYQHMMLAHEELLAFQRQLRKYREQKNKLKENASNSTSRESTINKEHANKFDVSISSFNRKARDSWLNLATMWNTCITTATRVAQEYDFEFSQNDSFEELVSVLDDFICDLSQAHSYSGNSQNHKNIQRKKSRDLRLITTKLKRKLQKRPSLRELQRRNIILDNYAIDKAKKKSEAKKEFQVQLLENLAKSNDFTNQMSNTVEAVQKPKRRKHSLTSTEIQIGTQNATCLTRG